MWPHIEIGEPEMNHDNIIRVMDMIIEDCKQDVIDFEYAPFSGKTVGTLHGILEAKILTLAEAIKQLSEVSSV